MRQDDIRKANLHYNLIASNLFSLSLSADIHPFILHHVRVANIRGRIHPEGQGLHPTLHALHHTNGPPGVNLQHSGPGCREIHSRLSPLRQIQVQEIIAQVDLF